MSGWIPPWENAYCPNCGRLTDTVHDTIKENRIKVYCKECELMFDISYSFAYIDEQRHSIVMLPECKEVEE